jgi:hypothetical protein
MNIEEVEDGQRVIYVPNHADSVNHPDCEQGTVSSHNAVYVFVRFDQETGVLGWDKTTAQGCLPEQLVKA